MTNNLRPNHPDAILSLDKHIGRGISVPFIEIRRVKIPDSDNTALSIITGDAAGNLNEVYLNSAEVCVLRNALAGYAEKSPRPPATQYPKHPEGDEDPKQFHQRRIEWVKKEIVEQRTPDELAELIVNDWNNYTYVREGLDFREKKLGKIYAIYHGVD